MLSRPDGFMLSSELINDVSSSSEMLYPNMKIKVQLIRAKTNFYLKSDNPNFSFGVVDCSLRVHLTALKDVGQR